MGTDPSIELAYDRPNSTALSLIERGERDAKLITLLKVAEKGLGISGAELLEGISLDAHSVTMKATRNS